MERPTSPRMQEAPMPAYLYMCVISSLRTPCELGFGIRRTVCSVTYALLSQESNWLRLAMVIKSISCGFFCTSPKYSAKVIVSGFAVAAWTKVMSTMLAASSGEMLSLLSLMVELSIVESSSLSITSSPFRSYILKENFAFSSRFALSEKVESPNTNSANVIVSSPSSSKSANMRSTKRFFFSPSAIWNSALSIRPSSSPAQLIFLKSSYSFSTCVRSKCES
mmetsp:Transcript_14200/g.29985  ORF Transcript_14200/g.29985 Transcript_14200/m.29985 type:complete len:222 (-) Transcript_14200:333-998(-)